MNYVKKGFSLIECMVYLSLLTVLVPMVFVWLSSFSSSALKQNQLHTVIDLYLARDFIVQDIQKGSADIRQWKLTRTNYLIWNMGNDDIGWELRDNKLYRYSGQYDQKKDQWNVKSKSVIAQGITRFSTEIKQVTTGIIQKIIIGMDSATEHFQIAAVPFNGRKLI